MVPKRKKQKHGFPIKDFGNDECCGCLIKNFRHDERGGFPIKNFGNKEKKDYRGKEYTAIAITPGNCL